MSRSAWRTALALLTVTCCQCAAEGQPAATITISHSAVVSTDSPTTPHAESFLAVNPKKPRQMLASSIVFLDGKQGVDLYVTDDEGWTWRRSATSVCSAQLEGGDPIVYFDSAGSAFFTSVAGRPEGFRVWRSENAVCWNAPVRIPGGLVDREYLAVDTSKGPFAGRIYAVGPSVVQRLEGTSPSGYQLILSASSTDGGLTFSPAVALDVRSLNHVLTLVADPVVDHRGTLTLPFLTRIVRPGSSDTANGQLWIIVSEDGGTTYSKIRAGPEVGFSVGLGFRALRAATAPRAAIDQSAGRFGGRIYLLWNDFSEGRYDIKIAHSDDLGFTWSKPVTVNDNQKAADPSTPAMSINGDGVIAVIFNDRRDDPSQQCYRTYISASIDGGETFLPNVSLSSRPTCPNAVGNWAGKITSVLGNRSTAERNVSVSITGIPERFANGGDIQGLVATPDGHFHAAWINGESGVMQVWHTEFIVQYVGINQATPATPPNNSSRPGSVVIDNISVKVSDPVIDFLAKSLSFTATLKNETTASIPGPLTLVLDQLQSGLGGLTAANADNGLSLKGAAWTFSLTGSRALAPGEASETRQLRFQFDGKIPAEPRERFRGNFKVFSANR